MTRSRTDIHRPSAINPADYEFVAFNYLKVEDLGGALFLQAEREQLQRHMARTGGHYSGHEHGGNCHVCGSVNCIYTAVFYHAATNCYIKTGLDCAETLECGDIDAFRRNVRAAVENKRGKGKAQAILEAAGLAKAWEVYASDDKGDRREEETVRDIVGKLVTYGSISPAQANLLSKLVDRIERRPELDAQRAAEHAAASPIPTGDARVVVRGKVVMVRHADGEHVFYDQMMVQSVDGWKVLGGLPGALHTVEPGAEVEFRATLKVSDRDPKFGFFKRPTNVRLIEAAAA